MDFQHHFLWHFKHSNVVLVAQSCPTLCNPMDCCPPGSSVHGIIQARILAWVSMPFSRGSSWPKVWTWVSFISRKILYHLSHQGSPWHVQEHFKALPFSTLCRRVVRLSLFTIHYIQFCSVCYCDCCVSCVYFFVCLLFWSVCMFPVCLPPLHG